MLTLKGRRENMQLDGLKHMGALLEGLRAVLPGVPETEKVQRISMETNRNFLLMLLAGVAVAGIVSAGLFVFTPNQQGFNMLQAALLFFPALILLSRRPASSSVQSAKAARRRQLLDLLIGASLLGIVIWQIFF